MEGDELLRVFDGDRLPRFVIEHHLVLGAMILENAADVLESREQDKEGEEDRDADDAVDHVGGEAA